METGLITQYNVEPLQVLVVSILVLAPCVWLGHAVNRLLFSQDVVLPGFLTAMLVVPLVGAFFIDLLNVATIQFITDWLL